MTALGRRTAEWWRRQVDMPPYSLAEKWAERDVAAWEKQVVERGSYSPQRPHPFMVPGSYARAVRALQAAEHQLEIAQSGAWPDDDRAPRFLVGEPTRPG